MDNSHSETSNEQVLDQQIMKAVTTTLFEERPICLNALFRFQIGSSNFDGYEFAKEAWKRVATVTNSTVSAPHSGFGQSLEALRAQKDAVKKELKQFDTNFCKFYGRQPSRLDKECLRKLYEFHKQLKAYITAEEAKAERSMLQRCRASTAGNVAAGNQTLVPRVEGPVGVPLNLPANGRSVPTPQELDEKVLRAEKRALKIKLRRFEDEFFRQNGHKPQSYQEVGAVREEYARYKYLKETLQAMTGATPGQASTPFDSPPTRSNGSLPSSATVSASNTPSWAAPWKGGPSPAAAPRPNGAAPDAHAAEREGGGGGLGPSKSSPRGGGPSVSGPSGPFGTGRAYVAP